MAVDINGITLTGGTNTLSINNNGSLWSWDASGRMRIANQTACQTGSNQGAGVGYTTLPTGWNTLAWTGGETVNRQTVKQGNRFYAPVSGMYFLTGQSYMYSAVANSDYVHPLFSVNGSYGGPSGRGGSTSTTYRIRHYGIPNAGYYDIQISELKYLIAGDWVEFVNYHSSASSQVAYYHAFFAIALLG
jgi:hypothetical protein